MTTATAAQLAQLAADAGFTGTALTTAVAVALAENGAALGPDPSISTTSINDDPATGDYSVGAWQVNYFGNLLPSRTAAYGSPSFLQSNPQAQANAAYSISSGGTDFSPWTTFKDGAYAQYLPAAEAATASLGGAPVSANAGLSAGTPSSTSGTGADPTTTAVNDALGGLTGGLAGLTTTWVTDLYKALLYVVFTVGGLVLVILGLGRIFPGVTHSVTQTLKTAGTAAAVA